MTVRAEGEGRIRLAGTEALPEIVLDRPWARNAVSSAMVADLDGIVKALEAGPAGAVLLRGAGPVFCSGSDLSEVRAGLDQPDRALALCRAMTEVLARLTRLPLLRVAAVEGAALGGGAELMLCCHRLTLGQGATVGFVQASLGLSPGWGGAARLVERVGARSAALLLAEARRLTAVQAQAANLADEVVEAGAARAAAIRWLTALPAWGQPEVLRAAVAVAQAGGHAPPEEQAFAALWGGPAHRAALAGLPQGRGR